MRAKKGFSSSLMSEKPLKHFLVGFYRVPGVENLVVVETPLTGVGGNDYRNLYGEVQKLYPKAQNIVKLSSCTESRDPTEGDEWLNPLPGMPLRDLFPADDPAAEQFVRIIGTVFFGGAPCKISLRYRLESGTVSIMLIDRTNKHTTKFSEQFSAALFVRDLPDLIAKAVGPNAKDLRLKIKEHAADKPSGKDRVPDLQTNVAGPQC
jgi:hypothetical protein